MSGYLERLILRSESPDDAETIAPPARHEWERDPLAPDAAGEESDLAVASTSATLREEGTDPAHQDMHDGSVPKPTYERAGSDAGESLDCCACPRSLVSLGLSPPTGF